MIKVSMYAKCARWVGVGEYSDAGGWGGHTSTKFSIASETAF